MKVKESCRVCSQPRHAKWHELARGDLNPVALVQWIEALPHGLSEVGVRARIAGYILGVTGIDYGLMQKALRAEEQAEAND